MINILKNRLHSKEFLKTMQQSIENPHSSKQDSDYLKIEYEKVFELSPVGIEILDYQ